MSFFSRLLGKKVQKHSKVKNTQRPKELTELFELSQTLSDLLNRDDFLSRKVYAPIIEENKHLYDFFSTLKNENGIADFCKHNNNDINEVISFIESFESLFIDNSSIPKIVRAHNSSFVSRHLKSDKEYLDTILSKSDPEIMLDEDQRRVVLSDEDYSLVVAGAGAGKTTTIAAKVKYLVDKKGVDPKNILIVSFTNKAVDELKTRIKSLGINCPISTFHSAGYAILRKNEDEKLAIVDSGFLYSCVENYLKETVFIKPDLVKKIVLFFGSYFDVPFDGDKTEQYFQKLLHLDTSTLKGNMPDYETYTYDRKTGRKQTLKSEFVRSMEEVRIANFLYLNQINYIYEDPYKYHILRAHKPYTPDFHIFQNGRDAYIEHFGITENGTNSRYTDEQLWRYKKSIADKVKLHRQHGTNLITTYSKYNDGKDYLIHLQELLLSNGFELSPISYEKVYKQLASNDESKYIAKLVRLIVTFIANFKTQCFDDSQFDKWRNGKPNVRTKIFLEITEQCYLDYQRKLKESHAVDFEDMINKSTQMLIENQKELKQKIDFQYIIVDEYQDISRQRFNLTKALSEMCDAKIMAVGDDWQSIYGYAGSDISLFTKFSESLSGYADILKITKTYRNSQQLIDIAGKFIQKNKGQIQKSLISSKTISEPVIIETYSERTNTKDTQGKGGKYYGIGKTVEKIIGELLEENPDASNSMKILLVGRYGFDARNLCFSQDFWFDQEQGIVHSEKYKNAKLFYLTAHRSKGLGFDNVIILNARDDIYGFPTKIDNDPVLKLVVHDDRSIEYAEERRLFYVALTRTKNKVFIVTPKEHPSEFVRELINEHENVALHGKLDEETESNQKLMAKCPVCGYPLQLRYNKNIGLRLWMCTNETEICDFITNDLNGGELQIQKCDKCRDGYLIVKKGINYFLACTNFKKDGTGCGRTMAIEEYRANKRFDDEVNEFSDDNSDDNPSFFSRESDSDYKIRTDKESESKKENSKRKAGDVHKLHKEERLIDKERFEVAVDENGNLVTDWHLLVRLKECRDSIAFRDGVPKYAIAKSNVLSTLATYKPKDENEASQLKGITLNFALRYGKEFFEIINKTK